MIAENHGERLRALEIEMRVVKEGVANFRNFQQRGNTFFDSYEAEKELREKIDKRRSRIHFALLTCLITLVGWAIQILIAGHR